MVGETLPPTVYAKLTRSGNSCPVHLPLVLHLSRAPSCTRSAYFSTTSLSFIHSRQTNQSRIAMQFNAQPAVQDARFAPDDTNGTAPTVPDNDQSATSATRQHVDIDRQCGVPRFNGVPCASPLNCRSHSMHDKRSVPGRSAPLDQLLAQHQQELPQIPPNSQQ